MMIQCVDKFNFFPFLALDILAFERLLGSCMEVMKRNIGEYEEELKKLGLSNRDLRGK